MPSGNHINYNLNHINLPVMFTRWHFPHEFTAWALVSLVSLLPGATERPDLDGLLTVTPASPGGAPWGYDGDINSILFTYNYIYTYVYIYIYTHMCICIFYIQYICICILYMYIIYVYYMYIICIIYVYR